MNLKQLSTQLCAPVKWRGDLLFLVQTPSAMTLGVSMTLSCVQDISWTSACVDPENFVRGGPTLITFFFLVNEGREDPNTT